MGKAGTWESKSVSCAIAGPISDCWVPYDPIRMVELQVAEGVTAVESNPADSSTEF